MKHNDMFTGTMPRRQRSPRTLPLLTISALTLGLIFCIAPAPHIQADDGPTKPLSPFHLIVKDDKSDQNNKLAIHVRSYTDPEKNLSHFTRYEFEYVSKENPLLEKELFKTVQYFLERRGLKRDTENPEILITLNFYSGRKESYRPPETIVSTTYQSVWNTGFIGWTPMGFSSVVPITETRTIPGKTEVAFFGSIRMNFLDAAALKGGKKREVPPLLWIGEAQVEDIERNNLDIRAYAGTLFRSLLFEFPRPSNLPPKRMYRWATFGDIGLTLYYNHSFDDAFDQY